ENIIKKYRRRPLRKVMEEVEDEVKDTFSEHQLKIETIQIMEDELSDLSGANKPIEVKLFGRDQQQLRKLAEEVAETLEKKGKGCFDRDRVLNQFILLPDTKMSANGSVLSGPARAVPLFGLGDIKPVRTPDEQYRENQQPAIFVTADLNEEEAGLGSVVNDVYG